MKKNVRRIVILLLIVAGIFGYNRYMHGNLKIDRELVSDENLNLLAENWEKLAESQKLLTGDEARTYEDGTVAWSAIVNDNTLAFFTVKPDATSGSAFEISAYYHRNGLDEWLDEFATAKNFSRFGESTNHINVSNSRLEILYSEYKTKASADHFEAWFSELLQTVQS